MHAFTLKSTLKIVLFLCVIQNILHASLWLEDNKEDISCCVSVDEKKIGYKELVVKNGNFKDSEVLFDFNNSKVWVRDFDDVVSDGEILNDFIRVATPKKGSYHIFFEKRHLDNTTLQINATTERIYNKDADIQKSLGKEILGQTVGSHYDKAPLKELDFEIIALKPIKKHQINCCFWSGDIAQFKIYFKGILQKNIPLTVIMQTGWTNEVMPNEEGILSFEIPRTTYEKSSSGKRYYEKMIVEANYTVQES